MVIWGGGGEVAGSGDSAVFYLLWGLDLRCWVGLRRSNREEYLFGKLVPFLVVLIRENIWVREVLMDTLDIS